MTHDEIRDVVIEVIREQLAPDGPITEEALLESDLGADSLDRVEIAMMLEEKLNLNINDAKLEDINTVKDVVALVEAEMTKIEA